MLNWIIESSLRNRGAVVVAVLAVVLASPGMAQSVQAGVKAGVGFSNEGSGDLEDWWEVNLDSRTTIAFGGFFAVDLAKYFRVGGHLQYVPKGAKANFVEPGTDVDVAYKPVYLELLVPATLVVPLEGSPISPRLYAGPRFALEMSCKVSFEGVVGGDNVNEDRDCDDPELVAAELGAETKSLDFGLFFGAGADFGVGSGAITADILYNIGLTDLNDTPGTVVELKNTNWQILLGYVFRFGG